MGKEVDVAQLWLRLKGGRWSMSEVAARKCLEELNELIKKRVVWKGHDIETWQVWRDKVVRAAFGD